MSKLFTSNKEVALELTLKLLEETTVKQTLCTPCVSKDDIEPLGELVAKLYNAIYNNLSES